MDLSFILRQLQSLSSDYRIALVPLAIIVLNLLIFLVSKTFRQAGLFVLVLAFAIDYAIKMLPFDLYGQIAWLYNAVTGLYILGFIIFFLKVLKMSIRINNNVRKSEANENSKFKEFLKFTGITPFILMLVINLFNYNDIIPKNILTILTSISFIYMTIKTVYSTSRYLSSKDNFLLKDRMDFKEIQDFLNEDEKLENKTNSKNQGRRIKKSFDIDKDDDETIKIYEKPEKSNNHARNTNDYNFVKVPSSKSEVYEGSDTNKLSNTDIIKLVSGDFDQSRNITVMSITDLKSGEVSRYESKRPILKIHEENEYKIDLEFETVNEYDYGRFIDILLAYSKDKDRYKFELEVAPSTNPNNKIIFFDPSNVYDIDETDYANVGGKIISMNFPKYKINFITGN